MRIADIFEKPVDRAIDPVVKASSTEQLTNELEEYVVTPELQQNLNSFFDEYNERNATGNGAWIFGFFGSGKSHLLKMLAVLLENREVEGKKSSEYFLPKVVNDRMLESSISSAITNHPSESLLFNIDSKAPSREVPGLSSLLVAFIKMFYEHCGYYSEDAIHIGALERDLDTKGVLVKFRELIEQQTNKKWATIRSAAPLYAGVITSVFDEVNDQPPGTTDNIITYYQQSFTPSIEDFAGWVADYIRARPKGFRLNFFVDEIGQYIANDDKRMINLQTIAEELNVKCNGNSWVFVTSQENVEDIIGEMTKQSANDFSKIQARFKVKIPLTSKDTQTIIKQRLLLKIDHAKAKLGQIYDKYYPDFGVLFDFTDGAKKYRSYLDLEDFTDIYPFVPYQFDLFTTSLRGLSDHNALTGSHLSVGARSMLGVFQEVAKVLALRGDTDQGDLASYDAMFDGLCTSIKPEEYAAIQQAEGQFTSALPIRVLKALFMVKYCQDFRSTARNLRVLLFNSFNINANKLEQEIQAVLDDLERQVYIRRNGIIYEYLTSEEKDIENEIKNTSISTVDVKKEIGKLFTEAVVTVKKFTFDQGRFSTSYAYDVKVDGEYLTSQRNDLKVSILTSLTIEGATEQQLFSDVIGSNRKELTIILQDDQAFISEVRAYIKTDHYVSINSGSDNTTRSRIINDKLQANLERRNQLNIKLNELITAARFSAAGVEITDKATGTGEDSVKSAGKILVARAYPKLQQLKDNFSDSTVSSEALQQPIPGSQLPEYAQEVLTIITSFNQRGYAVMLGGESDGSLISYFSQGDYGWPDIAVRMAVAILYSNKQIEVEKADRLLSTAEVANALSKSRDLGLLKLKKTAVISPEELAVLTEIFRLITETNPSSSDARVIAEDLRSQLQGQLDNYIVPEDYLEEFPFSEEYKANIIDLESVLVHDSWEWYARDFSAQAQVTKDVLDDLFKAKRFMDKATSAGSLWKEIKDFLNNESVDIEYVDPTGEKTAVIRSIIEDKNCYLSSNIPQANALRDELIRVITDNLTILRQAEKDNLRMFKEAIVTQFDHENRSSETKAAFESIFSEAESKLDLLTRVTTVKGFSDRFKQDNITTISQLFISGQSNESSISKPTKSWKEVQKIQFKNATIEDEVQASEFVEAYHQALLETIAEGFVVLP